MNAIELVVPLGIGAHLRNKLGDDRLMLRVSGTALGYPPALLLLMMGFYGWAVESFWWLFAFFWIMWAWSGLLVSLTYYAKRTGAVTLIFAALLPWLHLFWLPLFHPFPNYFVNTVPLVLPLGAVEYWIKRHFGKKEANRSKKNVQARIRMESH